MIKEHVQYLSLHTMMRITDTIHSVSPMINIKGRGVHQWYTMFSQQCSVNVNVVKQCFSE